MFLSVTSEGVSGKGGVHGSTMDAPVRISPPSGVPSEAVAEIRCSHVGRKEAARALSLFSSIEPYPLRAIADADMRLRSGSESVN